MEITDIKKMLLDDIITMSERESIDLVENLCTQKFSDCLNILTKLGAYLSIAPEGELFAQDTTECYIEGGRFYFDVVILELQVDEIAVAGFTLVNTTVQDIKNFMWEVFKIKIIF